MTDPAAQTAPLSDELFSDEEMADNGAATPPPGPDPAEATGAGAGPDPTPPPADNGVEVLSLGITIEIPDLRNGRAEDIAQAAPKASIPSAYKWAHIEGMDHTMIVPAVEHVVRAQYAQILAGTAANTTDAEKRDAKLKAIILGAIRAGASASYKLARPDMNSTEASAAGTRITRVGNVLRVTAGMGTAAPKHRVAQQMEALTATEVKVIGTMIYLGMAVPVMQGVSLVLSGHHYLPTTKNTFAGMKRQALQVGGEEVARWVEGAGDVFDDMAFHKSCHPIAAPRKRAWAKDSEIAARLHASGHGAVAIRLPALPSDAQGGKAAIAVIKKASSVILGMRHNVSWDGGEALVRTVELAPEGREEIDAVNQVKSWVEANAPQIAFCAGIVQTLAESGTGAQETTLRAYSMRKITSEQTAQFARGQIYCRAYNTRMRQAAESGTFEDPNISI